MAESEEEQKSVLMKVKEESEEAGLKLNTQKMKIMEFRQEKKGLLSMASEARFPGSRLAFPTCQFSKLAQVT